MLFKFKSKNAGDVIMLEPNGRQILEIIGKEAGPQGIILPEQMLAAIQALETAMEREEVVNEDTDASDKNLGLRQRAVPFIDMLQRNHAGGSEVVWGV